MPLYSTILYCNVLYCTGVGGSPGGHTTYVRIMTGASGWPLLIGTGADSCFVSGKPSTLETSGHCYAAPTLRHLLVSAVIQVKCGRVVDDGWRHHHLLGGRGRGRHQGRGARLQVWLGGASCNTRMVTCSHAASRPPAVSSVWVSGLFLMVMATAEVAPVVTPSVVGRSRSPAPPPATPSLLAPSCSFSFCSGGHSAATPGSSTCGGWVGSWAPGW